MFKFNRSRPRIVQDVNGGVTQEENAKICGVMLADGSICRRPPAEKRVRCPEHKGMRIRTNVSTAKAIRAPKSESESTVVLEPYVYCQTKGNAFYRYQNIDPPQTVVESPVDESITSTNICGIILDDGSTCRRQPVKGRKRCHDHKGKRIRASNSVNQK